MSSARCLRLLLEISTESAIQRTLRWECEFGLGPAGREFVGVIFNQFEDRFNFLEARSL